MSCVAKSDAVTITYGGHSTYYIDTPGGMRIATDWSGAYRMGRLPDVVGAATNLLWGQGIDPSFESYANGAALPWVSAIGGGVSPTVTPTSAFQGVKSLTYVVTALVMPSTRFTTPLSGRA